MLPHAVASRSSDRWSQIWSEASDGLGPQPVALVDELARAGDELVARHVAFLADPDHRLAIRPRPRRPRSRDARRRSAHRRSG